MSVKVSVIVPNYNHEQFLSKRIESILSQQYQNFELILLDDKSNDGSVEVINKYREHPKVSQILINESNSASPFSQWKKGVDIAQGDFIWIAESDDFAEPTFLSTLVNIFEHNKNLAFAYCQSIEINGEGEIIGDYYRHTEDLDDTLWQSDFKYSGHEFVLQFLTKRNCIPNVSAVLFDRKSLEKIDENVIRCKYLGDWLFYIIALKDKDIYFVHEKLNYFRTHLQTTRSGKSISDWHLTKQEFYLVFNEVYNSFNLPIHDYHQLRNNVDLMIDKIVSMVPALKEYCVGNHPINIAIYGAGSLGVFALNVIQQNFSENSLNIVCFIDKKANEGEFLLDSVPVYSLNDFINRNIEIPIFIASVAYYQDIYRELDKHGLAHLIVSSDERIT